jgi:predicted N-acyltransferase
VVRFRSARRADYEADLKPSHRYNLRRRLKRSRALVELRTEVIQRPDPAALDEICALFLQTFHKSDTQFERLDRRFFEVFAALPEAWFITLRELEKGEMVAFMLCLRSGERVINKFIGLDYRRDRDWMLYFRLWDAAADWALSIGAAELQSGQTGYRAKLEIGHQLTPLWNYGRHRIAPVHWVYALVGRTISWASLDPQLAGQEED